MFLSCDFFWENLCSDLFYKESRNLGKFIFGKSIIFFLNPIPAENIRLNPEKKKKIKKDLHSLKSVVWYRQETAISLIQQEIQPTKIMFDNSDPQSYICGKEEISPEMAGVNSTDDGYSCGNENDGIMALLKEFGY